MPTVARSLDDALAPIKDGCVLAVPRESSGVRSCCITSTGIAATW
jgi:hypothetical protein